MPNGPVATCIGRSGTTAHFMTRNKDWKQEIHGFDPASVQVGYKYELDFSQRPGLVVSEVGLNNYWRKDVEERGLTPLQGVSDRTSPQAPTQQRPQARSTPVDDDKAAEITATAVVKSALESGQDLTEAMVAGIRWSSLWHELPPKVVAYQAKHDPTLKERASEEAPFNDDIPF